MIYVQLFLNFLMIGALSFGGGYGMISLVRETVLSHGWLTESDFLSFIAVSESTPGPIGINMATYVGFTVCGVPGAVIATVGEVAPSIIVILIVAAMLAKFRESRLVSNALYGLRPASSGLIAAACIDVALQVLLHIGSTTADGALLKEFASFGSRNWRGLVLAAVLIVFTNFVKPTKKWHPIIFIGISAVVGIVFHFGGV